MPTSSFFAPGYNLPEAQLLMTLSALSYLDATKLPTETTPAMQAARMRADINRSLGHSTYSDWQIAWGPGLSDDRSNMLYVAYSPEANQYAVVIRGTDWLYVLDWLEDFATLALVPFTPANNPTVEIALGTSLGLSVLTSVMGLDPAGHQTTLVAFLKQVASQSGIFITGHSLGGCLASVLAPFLTSSTALGSADRLKVYTFAAPSAGNASFATYYNHLFVDKAGISIAYRIYNDIDLVPNGWASLPTIKTYFPNFINCPADIQSLIDLCQSYISGKNYTQVGTESQKSVVRLAGQILYNSASVANESLTPIEDALFMLEALWQHQNTNYLRLLGAPVPSATTAKIQSFVQQQSLNQRK